MMASVPRAGAVSYLARGPKRTLVAQAGSRLAALSTGEMIEAAMVGGDGVVGASASLDGKISFSRAIVQMAGEAMICEVSTLKGARCKAKTCCRSPAMNKQSTRRHSSPGRAWRPTT
jgi:hypothetical protein